MAADAVLQCNYLCAVEPHSWLPGTRTMATGLWDVPVHLCTE